MTETGEAGELSVAEAVSTLEKAASYEEPLRRRTEGVIWMIWGMATAGIQLSFDASSSYVAHDWAWWITPIVLGLWVALAVAATYATWRIAMVNEPGVQQHRGRSLLVGLLWLPLVYLFIGAIVLVTGGWDGALSPMFGIGATWLVLGVTNGFNATEAGRRSLILAGTVILLTVLALFLSVDTATSEGRDLSQLALIFVGGGAPFLAGLWQSFRG